VPAHVAATPQQYTLHITVLPRQSENLNTALMVAHLPEDARVWFEEAPTKQTGTLRQFESPPLVPGKTYTYTVRVAWAEDGRWVSQVHVFPVHAGDIHCIDVIASKSQAVSGAVNSNLGQTGPG
jgi:uncharacterized protein (TIGR03000 family)